MDDTVVGTGEGCAQRSRRWWKAHERSARWPVDQEREWTSNVLVGSQEQTVWKHKQEMSA
jgi:hypothetical protein